jgi:23S rRNA (adenine2503-C2)-methyltransferase
MDIVARVGSEDVAMVYVGEYPDGELVEFVEAVQPPMPREQKWVLMVSTLYGCPVECKMCDAGGFYHGKVPKDRLLAQIDQLVYKHYPDGVIPCEQFKIQFARMGEPAFNREVLRAMEELPTRYTAPGLMPSLSTIAPAGVDRFFEELRQIKDKYYSGGRFQFQFSMHTSDEELRKTLIPVKTWSFERMAEYGESFYQPGDRKITLNFALAEGNPVEPEILLRYFDPEKFLIKITPLNPTYSAENNNLNSYLDPNKQKEEYEVPAKLEQAGYRVIVSIGEAEENLIGSNCGQFVLKHVQAERKLGDGYLYKIDHDLEG